MLRQLVAAPLNYARETLASPTTLAAFFTGGDQVKITTKLKGTDLYTRISELYDNGALLAGTSAVAQTSDRAR